MEVAVETTKNAISIPTSKEEPFVCRRVVSTGVVVTALHPVAGPIYCRYVDESDCNAPDYFGLTSRLEHATILKSGEYPSLGNLESFLSMCLSGFCESHIQWDETLEDGFVRNFSWQFNTLAKKVGCTSEELIHWLHEAKWVEAPAPLKIYFLSNFNGFVGYRPVWSEDVGDAFHWTSTEIAAKDDLDVDLARSLGSFCPVSQAMIVTPAVDAASGTALN